MPRSYIAPFVLSVLALSPLPAANVYLTYHWHLHQPIYWPEQMIGLDRYQFAYDSIQLKFNDQGNYYAGSSYEHPRNHLWDGDGGEYDAVFSKDDRRNVYQGGARNSIATLGGHPNAGASVSYSGSLQENIGSLGRHNFGGYGTGWADGYREAHGWTTSGGHPKADMLGMTYHHAFSPLLPKSVLRKEIQIFKEIWWKSWGGNPDKSDHSKGFWPIEGAFSRHMIPILLDEGYEWSIIANSHLARTCQNYMDVAQRGNSGWNIDPPNRADRLGPNVPADQWWSSTIDGRGGAFPAPYAYQAHRAQYIDPATGQERLLAVVPMCDLLSYQNGFGTMGTGQIESEIAAYRDAPYNDTGVPLIILFAHDGDNAWGGGSSYYFESVPALMNEAASKGYKPSTIQQYLSEFDHNQMRVVHIEDGGWVNAANDWGHPQFINWLWPPQRDPTSPAYDFNDPRTWPDFETPGWTEDWRNWAVIVAATNYLETAEQLWTGDGGTVEAWRIQEPNQHDGASNNANFIELGWHLFLGGLDSGFMYYGTSLDDEVKQTLACNRALSRSAPADGDLKGWVEARTDDDETAPTVFKPQRYPWNPGGMGWGPNTGYRTIGFDGNDPWPSAFHVWTHVYDVSGVQSVTLKVRIDNDGLNPLDQHENETYAGGSSVGAWIDIPMTKRSLDPAFNGGNSQIDFFMLPDRIADYYFAKVEGAEYKDRLLDYYIEAVDNHGNVHRSDIQHVYVEDDGLATDPPDVPTGLAATPVSTESIQLSWNASSGASRYVVYRDGLAIAEPSAPSYTDTGLTDSTTYTYSVKAFNAAGTSASSDEAMATTLSPPPPDPNPPFVMDGDRDFDAYLQTAPGMTLYAALRGTKLYVATWTTGNGAANDHFILVADQLLPNATTAAPWGKAGFTAAPEGLPFLAAEADNAYLGWFNAPESAAAVKSATDGEQMEGVIDLREAFTTVPDVVYIAALAYPTDEGGALAAQAPDGNGDGNVDLAEFLALPLVALKDVNGDGAWDRADPRRDFVARAAKMQGGEPGLTWATLPGRSYQVRYTSDFQTWHDAPDGLVTASSAQTELSYTWPSALENGTPVFFTVELVE